jgi:hypothetical protein
VVVLPKSFTVPLVAGVADVTLEPTTAAWVWRVDEMLAGTASRTIHTAVPDVPEVDYPDLVTVDPATLEPTAEPEPAWVAMANSTVTTGTVTGDNLILTRTDGTTVDAGRVTPTEYARYIQLAKDPDTLVTGAITVDSNDLTTSAEVLWPDGTPGIMTITARHSTNAVTEYNITYGNPATRTYTQPLITRNTNGAATNVPQIVVS